MSEVLSQMKSQFAITSLWLNQFRFNPHFLSRKKPQSFGLNTSIRHWGSRDKLLTEKVLAPLPTLYRPLKYVWQTQAAGGMPLNSLHSRQMRKIRE
ncbi:hypothetical protein D6851_14730 [Altericroceibacterium spongiae]|uniref:Uncharacterized protein n=1 Tax=Altericroceibacterium spongiae TaxID=2320269 RepID=A0A420ECI7_9SPHN|nr:hypothetical protein D6851_14730 [Altericroceibacterium spongiae]